MIWKERHDVDPKLGRQSFIVIVVTGGEPGLLSASGEIEELGVSAFGGQRL